MPSADGGLAARRGGADPRGGEAGGGGRRSARAWGAPMTPRASSRALARTIDPAPFVDRRRRPPCRGRRPLRARRPPGGPPSSPPTPASSRCLLGIDSERSPPAASRPPARRLRGRRLRRSQGRRHDRRRARRRARRQHRREPRRWRPPAPATSSPGVIAALARPRPRPVCGGLRGSAPTPAPGQARRRAHRCGGIGDRRRRHRRPRGRPPCPRPGTWISSCRAMPSWMSPTPAATWN